MISEVEFKYETIIKLQYIQLIEKVRCEQHKLIVEDRFSCTINDTGLIWQHMQKYVNVKHFGLGSYEAFGSLRA